jgi:hypothetical protein
MRCYGHDYVVRDVLPCKVCAHACRWAKAAM